MLLFDKTSVWKIVWLHAPQPEVAEILPTTRGFRSGASKQRTKPVRLSAPSLTRAAYVADVRCTAVAGNIAVLGHTTGTTQQPGVFPNTGDEALAAIVLVDLDTLEVVREVPTPAQYGPVKACILSGRRLLAAQGNKIQCWLI